MAKGATIGTMATTKFESSVKRVNSGLVAVKGDLRRAKSLIKEKRFEEALTEVEAAIKADSASLQAHFVAGNLKARLGRKEEALVHFQSAIRINPSKTKPYLRAGKICLEQKKYDDALSLFEAAIKVNPKLAVAYVAAGQALLEQQKYDRAVERFTQSLRLNPRMIAARQRLAVAYSKLHKYSEAAGQLQAALRVAPDNTSAYAALGRVHLLQKNFAAAQEAYRKAIALKPEGRASVHLGLAEALLEENRLAEANQVLTEIPQKGQLGARLHTLWGDLYKRQGLFKQSAEEYQAAAMLAAESDELSELTGIDFMQEKDDSYWEQLVESFNAKAQVKIAERRSSL